MTKSFNIDTFILYPNTFVFNVFKSMDKLNRIKKNKYEVKRDEYFENYFHYILHTLVRIFITK